MAERTFEPASGPTAEHPPEGSGTRRMSFGQHVVAFLRELIAVLVGAVIVASLLRGFVGQMFLIPSASMENTLQVHDRVLVEKLSSIKRGQVVVFKDPGGWLAGAPRQERGPAGKVLQFVGVLPDPSAEHLIKRVVGLPGDRVVCCDDAGRLMLNGRALDETSYLYTDARGQRAEPSDIRFDVVVPAGHLFVLGDNRANSRDSRCHLNDVQAGALRGQNAFVPSDLVVGHAIAVLWPASRVRGLPVPTTFDDVPTGKQPPPATPAITAGPEATC